MAWIGAIASIGGALLQSDAAGNAAGQASGGANQAAQLQKQMFDVQNEQQAPYRQSGYNALGLINRGFGTPFAMPGQVQGIGGANQSIDDIRRIALESGKFTVPGGGWEGPGSEAEMNAFVQNAYDHRADAPAASAVGEGQFAHQFGAEDLNANMAPNWKFALDQGIGATKNAANLQTGLLSGNTLKGIADYTLNKSGDLYQQAYNNYNTNQSNIFNRLSTLAGLGSAANSQSAGLAGSLAPSIGNAMTNAGAAQAAGTIGSANALAGGGANALGWYQASQYMQPQTGSNNYNASGGFQPYYPMSSDSYG